MAKKAGKAAVAAPKAPKLSQASKLRKKSELYQVIADHTMLSRKQVGSVFEAMGKIMAVDLAKPSRDKPRMFVVPGLMKIVSRYKPATPERRGIDPFTKTEKTFKAKPASTSIKVRPLKALKAAV